MPLRSIIHLFIRLSAIWLMVGGGSVWGESSVQDELQQIAIDVKTETEQLSGLKQAQKDAESSRRSTEAKLSATTKRLKLLGEELEGLGDHQKSIGEKKSMAELQASTLKTQVNRTFRMTLLTPVDSLRLRSLFNVGSASTVETKLYLAALLESQTRMLRKLLVISEEVKRLRQEAETLKVEKEQAKKRLEAERRLQQEMAASQALKIKQLKVRQEEIQKSVARLKGQKLRLETALQGLGSVPVVSERSSGAGDMVMSDNEVAMKGACQFPTSGRVLRKFSSKAEYTRTGVSLRSKGTELSGKPRGDVVAIHDGTVVFSGDLPGYNTVVIVDHGERRYSLYGALGSATAARGEKLQQGEVLGKVNAEGAIYFEIREQKVAVNPAPYFRVGSGF